MKGARLYRLITEHPAASLILLAFVVLAVGYSLATPPLEAGDESRHYAVIKYIAETGRLPVQNVAETEAYQHHWSHEGNQPPLYYVLAAALTGWIETGRWSEVFWYNPHTTVGNPLRPDNKNITIHPPGEGWPWRGHVLAVHLIRFMSILMAAVTVGAAYAIALRLFRENRWPACGAMAITAFNPMFIFISAAINNDNAVIMFVNLALWLMVILVEPANKHKRTGQQATPAAMADAPASPPAPSLRAVALLGLLVGLGALSKLYAFGLLPLAGLLFFWLAYRQESGAAGGNAPPAITGGLMAGVSTVWRNFLTWSGVFSLVFLAAAGWFYLRNALLYEGDIFALQVMRETAGQRQEMPSLATLRAEFEGFRIAYWALFGGVNILAADWIYTVLDWAAAAALLGLVGFWILDFPFVSKASNPRSISLRFTGYKLRLVDYVSRPVFLLLLGWGGIMAAGFFVWNMTQPAGQGRLLYPAIAAISALGMLGLSWWLPPIGQKLIVGLAAGGLFLFAALAPLLYIAPAYERPPILAEADLPEDLQPVNYVYDDAMRLIGYRLPLKTIRPAERLPVILYWQMLRPVEQDYSIFIHLLGRQRQVIGQLDTYPGGGKWPTSLLAAGDILADAYEIAIPPEAEFGQAPTRLQIATGIYQFDEPGRPGRPVVNAAGEPVEPIIAEAKLVPWQWPEPVRLDHPINFSDKATLLSYRLADDQPALTLNWRAEAQFEADYTVFIQAWRNGEYVTGFDGPPVQGNYPTSLWSPGEIIVDTHPLDLTGLLPGTYDLLVGLYNPMSGDRLPAFGPDGQLPDAAVNVGKLKVPAE